MKTTPLWLSIVALVITNLLFAVMLLNSRKNQTQAMAVEQAIEKNRKEYELLVEGLLRYLPIDGKALPNISMCKVTPADYSTEQDSQPVQSVVQLHTLLKSKKVVFCFSKVACNSCVSEQFVLLNKLARKIGKEKILILTDDIQRDVALYALSNKLDVDIYESKGANFGITFNYQAEAVLFIVVEGKISSPYVLNMETKLYVESFYKFAEQL